MGNSIKRFDKLLTTDKTALLIIDIQEKIICVINEYETVVENTIKLIKGFKALEFRFTIPSNIQKDWVQL